MLRPAIPSSLILATILTPICTPLAADPVTCVRKTNDWGGFADKNAFASWYPDTIYFERASAEAHKTNRVRFSKGYEIYQSSRYKLSDEIVWEMLPKGPLFAMKRQKAGFQQTRPVKYGCDAQPKDLL